ncbi:hypothetical protein F5Y19DRAFT_341572 [Xylariaceae sp. FL1651]|nr:hypothetical protein F5Y19DRAFT_341572 [Xylariaceae sp. FL1651]
MTLKGLTCAAITLLAAVPTVNAHTWVEYLYRIDSTGAFTGDAGYPIGYIPRSQGVSDDVHQNKILDTSTNPAICKPLSSSNAAQYPPLQAAAGDYIAMQYQENGHVTQPDLTLRPYRGGNVYVYGTMQHKDSDGINDVLNAWTADGKGGNQKGKLIATHFFDDGQCFQDNPGNPIAQQRKAKYGVDQLYCQTDLQLPTDLPTSGTYTLMWVWDWPRIISDSQNVTEIYTTCAQIDLSGSSKTDSVGGVSGIKFAKDNKVQSAGISSQLHQIIEATALGVGTNSPPAPTGLGEATGTPQATATSSKKGNGHGHVKTVTVTADPETVTQYKTVTIGAGNDNGNGGASSQQSTTATTTAVTTKQTQTSAVSSLPTTLIPVTSIQGFLKNRARVTGQARREASGSGVDEQ